MQQGTVAVYTGKILAFQAHYLMKRELSLYDKKKSHLVDIGDLDLRSL